MWRTIGFASLMVGLLALGAADVTGQNQKKNWKEVADIATDSDYKALQGIKEISGKLEGVNTTTITFRTDNAQTILNPKYNPKAENAAQQKMVSTQAKLARAKPAQQQQLLQQLQQEQLQMQTAINNPTNPKYIKDHHYKDYELEMSEKVVIRKMFLDNDYDDKGNLKVYTSKEKAELRGSDSSKPGYKAKMEDLQAVAPIRITLKMPKKKKPAEDTEKSTESKTETPKSDTSTEKTKKADGSKEEVVKPIITMIVILQPPDTSATTDTPTKKKKKDQ